MQAATAAIKLTSGEPRGRISRNEGGAGAYAHPDMTASCWIKCHHPDIFCIALLKAQPMGFYAPAHIVHDAEQRGVRILPVCVNASGRNCTLEPGGGWFPSVRLGIRMAKGLAELHAGQVVERRSSVSYVGLEDVRRRAGVPVAALEKLADADAFLSLSMSRRQALWAIQGLDESYLGMDWNQER